MSYVYENTRIMKFFLNLQLDRSVDEIGRQNFVERR